MAKQNVKNNTKHNFPHKKSKKKGAVDPKKKKSTADTTVKKNKNSSSSSKATNNLDWISSLAAKSSSTATSEVVYSKQERKNKRNEKKRRREERKGKLRDDQQDSRLQQLQASRDSNSNTKNPIDQKRKSMYFLENLSEQIECVVEQVHPSSHTDDNDEEPNKKKKRKYIKPYISPDKSIKGKAISGQQLTDQIIQPRKRDYGGLGLARPSILLSLRDHSFVPKLEEEFAEHVEGFFGKQRTKAMKKQLDGNMLWRRLLDEKKKSSKNNNSTKNQRMNIKIDGKKLSDMSPDERVEAMIKLDML